MPFSLSQKLYRRIVSNTFSTSNYHRSHKTIDQFAVGWSSHFSAPDKTTVGKPAKAGTSTIAGTPTTGGTPTTERTSTSTGTSTTVGTPETLELLVTEGTLTPAVKSLYMYMEVNFF